MGASLPIFINARAQTAGLSGVQRYSIELQSRMDKLLRPIAPVRPRQGIRGHLWEQFVLPRAVRQGLLWSPANSGPLAVKNQVLTVHDLASLEHPEWFSSAFAAWYRWMTPRLIRGVRRVITVSEFSKQRLLALTAVDDSHVVVIPEGADSRFYPRGASEVERVRRKLNIPSPAYLLSLGSLEPRKNLRRLLAAWAMCESRISDGLWLVIAGHKGSSQVFSRLDLGRIPHRVHFTNFVEDRDLPALYSGALALATVSIYEGFGLPALEAMSCGAVPLAADNTALPEVVGDAGVLVNPFDTEAIAAGIERLANDNALRNDLRMRALRRSREFSWERTTALTWNILHTEAVESATEVYSKSRRLKARNVTSLTDGAVSQSQKRRNLIRQCL